MRHRAIGFILAVLLGICSMAQITYGACPCDNCAADPVFIQQDSRDRLLLAQLRRAYRAGNKIVERIARVVISRVATPPAADSK